MSSSDNEISLYEPPPVISGVIEGNIGITDEDLKKFESCHIMIADANKIDSSILSSIFDRMGAISDIVKSETDAIREIIEYGNYYDVVFIDQYIPQKGVLDLAQSIRYDSRFDTMPLIAMSHLGEDEPATLVKNGINGLIRKPLMSSSIYSVLEIFIGKKASMILDVEDGLSHTNNDKELYKMILQDFQNQYKEADREIIKYIYREEYSKLGETIVDIEGLSGTMGAILFHEVSKEMLKKYRDSNYQDIAFLLPRFRNELYKLLDKIEKYLNR